MSVLDWFMDSGWKWSPVQHAIYSQTQQLQGPVPAVVCWGERANTLTLPINFEFNFDCASRRAMWGGFFIAKWDEQLPSIESETWVNCKRERERERRRLLFLALLRLLLVFSATTVRLLQLILQPRVHGWWGHTCRHWQCAGLGPLNGSMVACSSRHHVASYRPLLFIWCLTLADAEAAGEQVGCAKWRDDWNDWNVYFSTKGKSTLMLMLLMCSLWCTHSSLLYIIPNAPVNRFTSSSWHFSCKLFVLHSTLHSLSHL